MKDIVVFSQNRNFFGAQIVLIPLLMALRNKYPGCRITLFTRNPVSLVLNQVPGLLDDIYIENNRWAVALEYKKRDPDFSLVFRKRSLFIGLISLIMSRGETIGFCTNLNSRIFSRCKVDMRDVYRANNYLSFIGEELQDSYLDSGDKGKEGMIYLIPGAGAPYKEWGLHNYLELADKLAQDLDQDRIQFILGKKEEQHIAAIEDKGFSVQFNLSLDVLIARFKKAELVVANDCGPSHIAQIFSHKYVILYSNEKLDADRVVREWFYPRADCNFLIGDEGKPLGTLKLEKVYRMAKSLL